jgi:signal transduction histidine kinase/DNA-binding response OmpR family regulator
MSAGAKVLIVEDEALIAKELERNLIQIGHQVTAIVSSGEVAVKIALETEPDLILMDIKLRGQLDGIEAARQISQQIDSAIIYLTAYAEPEIIERATQTDTYGYILKPFRERELAATIRIVLNKQDKQRALRQEMANSRSTLLQRLGDLTSAMVTVSGRLNLDQTLQSIADTARIFAEASYAALALVDSSGRITSFITSGLSKEEQALLGELPQGHGLLGALIKQGKIFRVNNIAKDWRSSGFPTGHPQMTNLLGVPVSVAGRVVGNLYLTDKLNQAEFSAEDEWWLTLFARQAAVAIENAQLYEKLQQAHHQLETLVTLTGTLHRSTQPQELFKQITQAACNLLQLPAAVLFLVSSQQQQVKLLAQTGLKLEVQVQQEFLLSQTNSVLWQVIQQQKPVNLAVSLEHFLPFLVGSGPTQALLGVPIIQNNEVTGILLVCSDQPRQFNPEEISLLQTFAWQASLALEKAQNYQHKEDFLSMTAHDLRAPSAAIRLSAGLLEEHLPANLLPQPMQHLVSNISRNSLRLQNLLDDLLEFNRLQHHRLELRLEEIEFNKTVTYALQTLVPLFEKKVQELVVENAEEECRIVADPRRLEQIIVNLLTNANKYTPRGGSIRLNITASRDWVITSVSDTGPGIPQEEQSQIFTPFYRRGLHEQESDTSGTGLGLPIARSLAELHGGQLWVESQPGQGSSFFLKLPRPSALKQG